MKFLLPLCSLLISLCIAAHGNFDRKGFEKVWLYYAYQIDSKKPKEERTVAVKCAVTDRKTFKCLERDGKVTYKHCEGSLPDGLCSFREFLGHISGNKGFLTTEPLDGDNVEDFTNKEIIPGGEEKQNDSAFDPVQTVQGGKGKHWMDFDVPPWCIVKDGTHYTPAIEQVGEVIAATRKKVSPEMQQHVYFRGMDRAGQYVVTTREIDNHARLLETLRAKKYNLATISHMSFGKTLNREQTIARNGNKPEIGNIIFQALEGEGGGASHDNVMKLWLEINRQVLLKPCASKQETV